MNNKIALVVIHGMITPQSRLQAQLPLLALAQQEARSRTRDVNLFNFNFYSNNFEAPLYQHRSRNSKKIKFKVPPHQHSHNSIYFNFKVPVHQHSRAGRGGWLDQSTRLAAG